MSRRALTLNSWLTPALAALVAALALAAGQRHFLRLDLTADGDFSLQPVTERIVEQLPDQLTIRVYFTADLEPPYHQVEGVVRDLLDEIRARNPGRVRVEWIDPTGDEARKAEARRLGVEPATLQVSDAGRREAREIWLGMVLVYRERTVALPTIRDLRDLEFQITRRVREVVEDRRRPRLGAVTGHGEPDLAGGEGALARIRDTVAETYEPVAVDLAAAGGVPDDVDLLVLIGPRQPLTDAERYAFDQFLMSGRPAAVFRTNVTPDPSTRALRRSSDALGELLAHYGVAMDTSLLVDRDSSGLIPVPVRQGDRTETGYANHPLVPRITDLDREQLITRGVDTLDLPLASPLRVLPDHPGCPDCTVYELARTAPSCVARAEVASLDPVEVERPAPGEQPGPFLVIAALEGSLRSPYAQPPATAVAAADGAEPLTTSPDGTRLLVVSSADYTLRNLGFFLNALDWLALDADLLALRPDRSLPPALQPLGRGQARVVRAINLLAAPVLVVAVSLIRARRRRGAR